MKTKWLGMIVVVALAVAAVGVGVWQREQAMRARMAQLMRENTELKNANAQLITEHAAQAGRVCLSVPASPPPPPVQSEVEAVLSPPVQQDAGSAIDALKQRYEDILVSHFVLLACQKTDPLDYHIIVSAMAQEMASLGAPSRLQYDILTAATGSYQEMFSGNRCEPAVIDPLRADYQRFIDTVAVNFMPR